MLIIKRLVLVLGLMFSSLSYSQLSILTKDAGQDSVILVSGQASDILTPAAPNSSGMSVMRFTNFDVKRPLNIINVTDSARVAAKLIVIETSLLNLRSSVEIVGEKADVLFINKSNSAATLCSSCSLKNISRATIAAGSVVYAGGWPGQITLTSGSSININNLNAAGVGAVELIAPYVVLNGTTNTQLRAAYGNDGSYLLSDSGALAVGYGNVDVYAGFNYQYSTLDLTATSASRSYGVVVNGIIKTQAAKILSTNPINMAGIVDTTSDMASSVSYRGTLTLVEESIKIATLVNGKGLYLNGKLFSDKSIQVSSAGELINSGIITADSLEGNAKLRFTNRGQLNIKTIKISAESMENNAWINGRNVILVAQGALLNRFGGKISGASVELVSTAGYIRNGSQYPFKPANDSFTLLTADSEMDIGLSTFSINGVPFQGATKVADLSAQIIGDKVALKAEQNIENINPYFEYTLDPEKWRSGVVFNYQKADQVQLIADTQLDISAGTYIVNSSAIMGVNDPAGRLHIVAPNVANERYTTEAVIQPFTRSVPTSNGSSTTTGFESLLVVFSPPGIMYSFAPVEFKFSSASGGFINNTSYFEVLNKADFVAVNGTQVVPGKVTSIGLALQDKLVGSSSVVVTSDKGCTNKFVYNSGPNTPSAEAQGRAYYASCGSWGANSNIDLSGQTTEQMRGTLFSVKGNLNGISTSVDGKNHRMIEDMDKDFLAAEIARNTWSQAKENKGSNNNGNYVVYYTLNSTSKLSADGKSIITSVIAGVTNVTGTLSAGNQGPPAEIQKVISENKTIIQKVEEFLIAQYQAMKTTIINALAAFDSWWNS